MYILSTYLLGGIIGVAERAYFLQPVHICCWGNHAHIYMQKNEYAHVYGRALNYCRPVQLKKSRGIDAETLVFWHPVSPEKKGRCCTTGGIAIGSIARRHSMLLYI
jgi:hypothetical protein